MYLLIKNLITNCADLYFMGQVKEVEIPSNSIFIPEQTWTPVPGSDRMDLSASPPWGAHRLRALAQGRRSPGYAGLSWHCSGYWPHHSYTTLPTQTQDDLEAIILWT